MLKPRKLNKRIPITLEAGLLKVLKGRVLRYDNIGEHSVGMYYTDAAVLMTEFCEQFSIFEDLLRRLEDKGVLEYGCSTWIIPGDRAGYLQAFKLPRATGQSRLKRDNKDHRLCTEEEYRFSVAIVDGGMAFIEGLSTVVNPYDRSSTEYQGWLDGWNTQSTLDNQGSV